MSGSSFTWVFAPPPPAGPPGANSGFSTAGQRETLYCVIHYRDIRANPAKSASATRGPLGGTVLTNVVVNNSPNRSAAYSAGTYPAGDGSRTSAARSTSNWGLSQSGPTKTTEAANSAVYIDPVTRDVLLDSTGKELGMDPVQQRIQILLNTRLGSIEADQTIGFKTPKKITSDVGRKLAVLVQNALKPMIEDGTIELTRVTAYIQQ